MLGQSRYPGIALEQDEGSTLPVVQRCSFCRRMTVESLLVSEGFQHATLGKELWRVLGCRICRKLWPDATKLLNELDASQGEGGGIKLKLENSKSGNVLRAYLNGKALHAERSGRPQVVYVTAVEREIAREFKIVCEDDRRYSGSQFHIERVKNWIQECQGAHEECKALSWKSEEDPLLQAPCPGRLIYIGNASNPRLVRVHSAENTPPYVTLSHCWGPSGLPDSAKTTSKNVDEREFSIEIASLPRNFQEAVEITRRLGFEYLWIDALCIVQDSVENWRKEAQIMDAIYSNSTITLAAESSMDAEGGLFSRTVGPDEDMDNPISITGTLSDGRTSTLIFRGSDSRSMKTNIAHLRNRAWCQQERILSARVVHFFDVGILWECRRHYEIWHEPTANVPWYCISHIGAQFGKEFMACKEEYMQYQKEHLLMESYRYATLDELQQVRQVVKEREFMLPRWTLYRPWFRYIVPEYTNRKLTFKSDKLPAISSIARALHRQTNSTYLAGLWDEVLALGLAWHPSPGPKDPETYERPPVAMPLTTPRPSWSWASYDFPCQWHMFGKPACYWTGGVNNTFFTSHIQLLSHSIELAGPDHFGQVLSGKLCVRGKAFYGEHFPGENNYDGEIIKHLECKDGKTRGWWSEEHIRPNGVQAGTDSQTVCLLLCSGEGFMYFLVLKQVEEPNVFERKSMFLLSMNDMGLDQESESTDPFKVWLETGEEDDFVLV